MRDDSDFRCSVPGEHVPCNNSTVKIIVISSGDLITGRKEVAITVYGGYGIVPESKGCRFRSGNIHPVPCIVLVRVCLPLNGQDSLTGKHSSGKQEKGSKGVLHILTKVDKYTISFDQYLIFNDEWTVLLHS